MNRFVTKNAITSIALVLVLFVFTMPQMALAETELDLLAAKNVLVGKVSASLPIYTKAGENTDQFKGAHYYTTVTVRSSNPVALAILQSSISTAIQWPCIKESSGKFKKETQFPYTTELTCVMPVHFAQYSVKPTETLNFVALLSSPTPPVAQQAATLNLIDLGKSEPWAKAANAVMLIPSLLLKMKPIECPDESTSKNAIVVCDCPGNKIYDKAKKACIAFAEPPPATVPNLPFSGTLVVDSGASKCASTQIIDQDGNCVEEPTPPEKKSACTPPNLLMLDGTCGSLCPQNSTDKDGVCTCNAGFVKDPDKPLCILSDAEQSQNAGIATSGPSCSLMIPEAKTKSVTSNKSFDLQVLNTLNPTAAPQSAGKLDNVKLTYEKDKSGKKKDLIITGIVLKGGLGVPDEFVAMDNSTSPATTLIPENNDGGIKRCRAKTSVTSSTFKCIYSVSSNKLTDDSKLTAFLYFPDPGKSIAFTTTPIVLKDFTADASGSVINCVAPQVASSDGKTCVSPSSANPCQIPTPVQLFDGTCGLPKDCGNNATADTTTFKCICSNGYTLNKTSNTCLAADAGVSPFQTAAGRNCSLSRTATTDVQGMLLFELLVTVVAVWHFIRKLV